MWWDADGNRYVDFNRRIRRGQPRPTPPRSFAMPALAQAGNPPSRHGRRPPGLSLKADLCEALSRITFERWGLGAGKTFLANSGSEAVEAALKTALLHNGKPGVYQLHGRISWPRLWRVGGKWHRLFPRSVPGAIRPVWRAAPLSALLPVPFWLPRGVSPGGLAVSQLLDALPGGTPRPDRRHDPSAGNRLHPGRADPGARRRGYAAAGLPAHAAGDLLRV